MKKWHKVAETGTGISEDVGEGFPSYLRRGALLSYIG